LIKKNVGRAGTSILQKTGFVEKTIDPEFNERIVEAQLYPPFWLSLLF